MNNGQNRRELLRAAAATTAMGLLAGSSTITAQGITVGALGHPGPNKGPDGRSRAPNILFILADDLGITDLGCYGGRNARTPVLDNLAREGVRLTQAYANSPVCSASRTAIITGRYQDRYDVGLQEPLVCQFDGTTTVGLPSDTPTLPALLKAAPGGYSTALIGKWNLGSPPTYGPLKNGYDKFFGFYGSDSDYFDYGSTPDSCALLRDQDEPVETGQKPPYLTKLLADEAVRYISNRGRSSQPFFLSLHFNAPHWPWEGPGDRDLQTSGSSGGSLETFAAMVESLDKNIGQVLAALDQAGLRNNTLVVFTSDNGGERYSDTWPYTGLKSELLEGGIRVPAIVRWPAGNIFGSRDCDQVMMGMDWLPTLLAAAGGSTSPSSPPDGINILKQLQGAGSVDRKLFWRYNAYEQAAARDGDWKYVKIGNRVGLFNVAQDPRERVNLAGSPQWSATFQRLVSDYQNWNTPANGIKPYPVGAEQYSIKPSLIDRYDAPGASLAVP